MFNFSQFVKNGLLSAIGRMPDYQITLSAASWYDKQVLNESDLAEIESVLNTYKNPPDNTEE